MPSTASRYRFHGRGRGRTQDPKKAAFPSVSCHFPLRPRVAAATDYGGGEILVRSLGGEGGRAPHTKNKRRGRKEGRIERKQERKKERKKERKEKKKGGDNNSSATPNVRVVSGSLSAGSATFNPSVSQPCSYCLLGSGATFLVDELAQTLGGRKGEEVKWEPQHEGLTGGRAARWCTLPVCNLVRAVRAATLDRHVLILIRGETKRTRRRARRARPRPWRQWKRRGRSTGIGVGSAEEQARIGSLTEWQHAAQSQYVDDIGPQEALKKVDPR